MCYISLGVQVLEAIGLLQFLLDNPHNDQLSLKLYENDSAISLYHVLVNPEPYMEHRRRRVPHSTKLAVLKVRIVGYSGFM